MTVMAAEAGASAFEAEAAEATAVSRTATGRARRAAPAPAARPDRPARPERPQGRRGGSSKKGRGVAFPFPGGGGGKGSNYHGVVLAEFVLAVLLVAATPFAKKNRPGISPYVGRDMVQLLAITILYFILAIIAGTGRGQARLAAWFGGLILLAVGLGEAAAIASAVAKFVNPPPGQMAGAPAPNPNLATTPVTGSLFPPVSPAEPAAGLSRNVAQEPLTPGATLT